MNSSALSTPQSPSPQRVDSRHTRFGVNRIGALFTSAAVCMLRVSAHAQVGADYQQDFNNSTTAEIGWTHYDPATAGGQFPTWTFPADGSGGFAYRMYGPPMNCNGLF